MQRVNNNNWIRFYIPWPLINEAIRYKWNLTVPFWHNEGSNICNSEFNSNEELTFYHIFSYIYVLHKFCRNKLYDVIRFTTLQNASVPAFNGW